MLKKFYAVCATSVYAVYNRRSEIDPSPFAVKIAGRGESKTKVGDELRNGTMLAITTQIQMYIPEGGGITSFERRIEHVSTRWWGGHSSPIVALFTNMKKALDCHKRPNLNPRDERWIKETRAVIDKIGADHPTFEVCRHPGLSLLG